MRGKPALGQFGELTVEPARSLAQDWLAEVWRDGDLGHDITALMKRMEKSPTQANRVLSLVRKMFGLAERWGYRSDGSNPCRHVPKYPEKGSTRLITDEQMVSLFAYLDKAEAPRYGKSPCVCPAILDHDKPLGPHFLLPGRAAHPRSCRCAKGRDPRCPPPFGNRHSQFRHPVQGRHGAEGWRSVPVTGIVWRSR